MLKTNSKKARENVRDYIVKNTCGESYGVPADALKTFDGCARFIIETYREEYKHDPAFTRFGFCFGSFREWCAGLPSALDTCYFYNRSAVVDAAAILEETPAESEKYSESDAENLLTVLIFRELEKAGRRLNII